MLLKCFQTEVGVIRIAYGNVHIAKLETIRNLKPPLRTVLTSGQYRSTVIIMILALVAHSSPNTLSKTSSKCLDSQKS